MNGSLVFDLIRSWSVTEGVEKTDDLLKWINDLNETTHVKITECSINKSDFWFFKKTERISQYAHEDLKIQQ